MPTDMKLILVRHGQTEWNLSRRTQGQHDSPLTDRGIQQAKLGGRALAKYRIDNFYCSDSGRAVQTAKQMIQENPELPSYKPDSRLRELNYGKWEGMKIDEIRLRYSEHYQILVNDPVSFIPPEGESFTDMQKRFKSFIDSIETNGNTTCLVVSHSELLRVGVITLLERPLNEIWSNPPLPPASITIMYKKNGVWSMVQGPDTGHLDQLERDGN